MCKLSRVRYKLTARLSGIPVQSGPTVLLGFYLTFEGGSVSERPAISIAATGHCDQSPLLVTDHWKQGI